MPRIYVVARESELQATSYVEAAQTVWDAESASALRTMGPATEMTASVPTDDRPEQPISATPAPPWPTGRAQQVHRWIEAQTADQSTETAWCATLCPHCRHEEATMGGHTYKLTEIVGTSPDSVDDAIRNGIAKAAKSVRNMDWFEVVGVRGQIADGAVGHYQVAMKVGFRLED